MDPESTRSVLSYSGARMPEALGRPDGFRTKRSVKALFLLIAIDPPRPLGVAFSHGGAEFPPGFCLGTSLASLSATISKKIRMS
jgi:hypothetical protein